MTKIIKRIEIENTNSFAMLFDDETYLVIQHEILCGKTRYMSTDDNLSYYLGAVYLGHEIKSVQKSLQDHICTEIEFIVIYTSRGCFQIKNYNIHNGEYGGFATEIVTGNFNEITLIDENNVKIIVPVTEVEFIVRDVTFSIKSRDTNKISQYDVTRFEIVCDKNMKIYYATTYKYSRYRRLFRYVGVRRLYYYDEMNYFGSYGKQIFDVVRGIVPEGADSMKTISVKNLYDLLT